ncbi:MAG: hypothetical protein LUF87_08850 [Alistipes sp.]|nr:hypothetical protein [Alistipes sp.]
MKTEYELVQNNILHNQSSVVAELIKSGAIPDESLYQEWFEVMEWWLVTPYLARLLKEECEVIVENCGCYWWGRQSTGQAIYMDEVISMIVRSFE